MRQHLVAALGLAAVVGASGFLWAQEGGDPPRDGNREQREGGGDRGDRGPGDRGDRGDRGDFRARMAERMKEQLQVSDEEWGVLQPKIEKVMEAQRASMVRGFGRGGPGGPGGPGGQRGAGDRTETPVAKASADLRSTLEKDNASTEEINKKLSALREARKQAEADLKEAREDLRSLLTPRQEAALVVIGTLD